MKTRLLYLFICICSYSIAQVPTDDIKRYTFRNGSIQNQVSLGVGDLNPQTSNGYTLATGWDGESNSALNNQDGRFVAGNWPAGSNTQSANMTYSVWVNWTASENFREVFRRFNNNQQAQSGGIYLVQQGGTITAHLNNIGCTNNPSNMCASSDRNADVQSPVLNDGNWHNVVVTYEKITANGNDTFKINMYVDGAFHGTDSTDDLDTSWQTYMYSGNRTLEVCGNQVFGYRGFIDDIRIFDRTLTATEAISLYTYNEPGVSSRIYVDTNATGNGDGQSWANAYTDLSLAQASNPLTLEFWVAQGTYIPGTSRSDAFVLNAGQQLFGGFNGTETMLTQRDVIANPTILSGDINSNDDNNLTFNNATKTDNSYHVVVLSGNNTLLDGVTISGGYADASAAPDNQGAAVFVNSGVSSVNLVNCIVTKNTGSFGGAIRALDNGVDMEINFLNSIFSSNLGRIGNVLYTRPSNGRTITFNSTNSLYHSNEIQNDGATNGESAVIWFRNDANGAYNSRFVNSTFADNISLGSGGNAFDQPVIGVGTTSNNLIVWVINTIFWNNTNNTGSITKALGRVNPNPLSTNVIVANSLDSDNFSNISSKQDVTTGDPLFNNSLNNDYTLTSGSPAIDTGVNSEIPAGVTTDLDGNQRIQNTTVDMGAYEFMPLPVIDRILTVTVANGTVTTNPNPTNGVYNNGQMVTLTVTPDAEFKFTGWSGDATGTTNPLTITMDADKNITANIVEKRAYVDVNATGNNDGTSWINAYTNLASALNNNPEHEIWVAQGTYTPSTNRFIKFIMTSNQKLYGGFNGTETSLSQRDIANNQTILSGDINGDDNGVLNFASGTNSLYDDNTFVLIEVRGDNLLIDGVLVNGAFGDEGSALTISNEVQNLTVRNTTFTDNRARINGVIYAEANISGSTEDHDFIFENCIFDRNLAKIGAVIYIENPFLDNNFEVNTKFINTVFSRNRIADLTSSNKGSNTLLWFRASNSTNQNVEIINSTFTENSFIGTSGNSTGIIAATNDTGSVVSIKVYNSIFWNNNLNNGNNQVAVNGFGGLTVSNDITINNSLDFLNFTTANSTQNNITADPLFNNVSNDNFRLTTGSPAIDSGDNSFLLASQTEDLDGNQRVFNTTVDMGAYEFDATLSNTDFVNENNFKIYPNPVSEILTISSEKQIKTIEIYSLLGSKIIKIQSNVVNVSTLENGVYLIKITDKSNQQTTKRFIKN